MLPQYKGNRTRTSFTNDAWRALSLDQAHVVNPAGYYPDEGLIAAVNVALTLNQPLLVTGEPGTGKTQLASSVAWEMGLAPPFRFETKSSSEAKDLFYSYDNLGRFQETYERLGAAINKGSTGQGATKSRARKEYVTYNALGLAIIYSNARDRYADWLPEQFDYQDPMRSVVLIDEIDKAPRDFPNDVLSELGEDMYFRVPELGMGNERISVDPGMRPIVIITSNAERKLPDAFLRRCVYYNIPFPKETHLRKIISARLSFDEDDLPESHLRAALELFFELRKAKLQKAPSTSELLGWLSFLIKRVAFEPGKSLLEHKPIILQSLGTLVKNPEDMSRALDIANRKSSS